MPAYDEQTLYDMLKELQLISETDLDAAFGHAKATNNAFHKILLEKNLISPQNLGRIIADQVGVTFVNLASVEVPRDILEIIPESYARRQKAVLFGKEEDGYKLAMNNPQNAEVLKFVAKKVGGNVVPYYATEEDVEEALNKYGGGVRNTFDALIKEKLATAEGATTEVSISEVVDLLIQYAYNSKASDIHIEPEGEISIVRFRIDGILHDILDLPRSLHDQVISRIKVLSKLRTDEHLAAQDGKMQVELEKEKLDIRVSIVPVVGGEKSVLRLLSSRARQFSLSDLGMKGSDLDKVREAYKKPYGMILSTGPTGSGKTTTIYAILKIINTRDVNIATIEDPVEYDIEGVNQIQANPKTDLTFAKGLRAILRQDPNVIFVGEIRDVETAGIAVNSAMTGHLVLSTLHTNDAATSLPRLIDMDIEPFLVASTVNVIIAQRLIRTVCHSCKISQDVDINELKKNFPEELVHKYFGEGETVRVYKGKGCGVCHSTGYLGRVGVFEVLEITPRIKDLITSKAPAGDIEKAAREEGMTTLLEDGLEKVTRGITTIEEILRVTKE